MKNPWTSRPKSTQLLAAALLAPSLGFAQSAAPEMAKPDYQLSYRSAFTSYEPYQEQKVQSWREANDKVGEIGGWRVYAKEMRQVAPASGQEPSAAGHDAHHGGKQ